jgi:hypothetical protein
MRLNSWNEFQACVEKIQSEYNTNKDNKATLLFRGQSNADWALRTTLDREINERKYSAYAYMCDVSGIINEIESLTEKRWNLDTPIDYLPIFKSNDPIFNILGFSGSEFWIYLRHHGFPSPLLDWSKSPYIAAYFAFTNPWTPAEIVPEKSPEQKKERAVYIYIRSNNMRSESVGTPTITHWGSRATTDKRHFAQKAQYTMCTLWNRDNKLAEFCHHEDGLGLGNDHAIKIILPNDLRSEILRSLDNYNINEFTLFQSEDALIKTLATRCFDTNQSNG